MKKFLKADVVVSAVLAAVIAFFVPLQTYIGNSSIYQVSAPRLVVELVAIFLVLTAGLAAVAAFAAKVCRLPKCILPSIFTAAAICVYLESGPLSFGIPELNGGFVKELASTGRAVFDAVVWGAIVCAFAVFAKRLHPYLHWVAISVAVLSTASLFDAGKPASAEAGNKKVGMSEGFFNQPTVVENVKYSSGRNILVFVLDSMPGNGAADVMRANPALASKFPGFTQYPRNIGMHECTKRGVPGIVTGHHYDPREMPQTQYPLTMYGSNSFVKAAADAGWAVAFSPDLMPYGFTNLPVEKKVRRVQKHCPRDRLAIRRQSSEVPYLSIFDMASFRISPFFFKAPILYARIRHAVKARYSVGEFGNEGNLYPALAAKPVAEGERPFLGFFHSWGVHPPWKSDFASVAVEKLSQLGELMDTYRARGIYDRSFIIVTSDHGLEAEVSPLVDGYPAPASAFLWVKPEGAQGTFAESPLKTSHANIARLVKAALSRKVSQSDADSILASGSRLYRAETRSGGGRRFSDWNADATAR